ncbi:MAG: LysR family transcriptional regulator [Gammaproteobacteria bacterium]|nr:LysR family transcriptional regulator [Gammaproteobacteria bacterium]
MTRDSYDVLDLKALRCFWAAATHGNLTRAGIELGISESAVSQRIRALERRLGRKLYEARGGHLRLTDAGEQAVAVAERVFQTLDRFESSIAGGEPSGTLTIAAYESALRYLLPDVVRRFRARHPQVFLRLLSRGRREMSDAVLDHAIDAGIVAEGSLPEGLDFIPWRTSRSLLLIPKGHPLLREGLPSFETLLDARLLERYPLLVSAEGSAYTEDDRIARVLRERSLPYRVAFEVGNIDTVKHYVSIGMGIAVVPDHCVMDQDDASFDCLEVPAGLRGETTFGLLLHRRRYQRPALAAFAACMGLRL